VDENWWQGQIDRDFGIFPLTHVVEVGHSLYSPTTNCEQQVEITSDSEALQSVPTNDQPSSLNTETSTEKSDHVIQNSDSDNTNRTIVARAEALSDLTAQLDEELTFKTGEIIEITQIVDSDFAIGRCADGRSGHFPLAFVKVFEGSVDSCLNSLPKEQHTRPKFDWWKDPNAAVKPQTATSCDVVNSRPSFEEQTAPITPITVEEYSLNTSHKFYSTQSSAQDEVFQSGLSSTFPSGCFVRALFQFVAENDNELSLLPGDIVHIIGPADEQWIEGEMGSRRGIFPMTFVELCPSGSVSEVRAPTHNAIACDESLNNIDNTSEPNFDLANGNEYATQGHVNEIPAFQETLESNCAVDTPSYSDETGGDQHSVTTVMAPANENSCDIHSVACVDHTSQLTTGDKSVSSSELGAGSSEDLKLCIQDQSHVAPAIDVTGQEAKERVSAAVENPPGEADVGVSVSKPSGTRDKPAVSPKRLVSVPAKPEINRPKPQLKPKPAASVQQSNWESKSNDGKQLSDSKSAVTAKRPAVATKSAELRQRLDMSTRVEAATASSQHGSQGASDEVVCGDLRNKDGLRSSDALPGVNGKSLEARGDTGAAGIAMVVPAQVPVPAARSDARYQNVMAERRPPRSVSFDEGVKTYIIDNGVELASELEGRRCGNSTFYSDFETTNSSLDAYTTEPLKAEPRMETPGRNNSRSSPVPPKRPSVPVRSVTVEAAPRHVLKQQEPKMIPCRPAPPRPVAAMKKAGLSLCLGHTPESGNYALLFYLVYSQYSLLMLATLICLISNTET
jgi:growth factor receptor-binding protein 2